MGRSFQWKKNVKRPLVDALAARHCLLDMAQELPAFP
jgi:hypothetical protein